MIVIICAMEREAKAIINAMSRQDATWSRDPYMAVVGRIDGVQILVVISNAGKVNAAAAAVQAYFTVKPSIILNIGVCGALDSSYKQGDIVVPTAFMQHDIDTTAVGDRQFLISGLNEASVPADELGVKYAAAIEHAGLHPVMEELCATGDSFIEKGECREMLFDITGAGICDMEAGAIAQVCAMYGVPFAAAKVVSDGKDGSAKDYEAFMKEAPQIILGLARAGIAAYGKRGDS